MGKDNETCRAERLRIKSAFLLSVAGILVAALLVVFLVCKGWNEADDVVAVIGIFTSVLGTLVGAFLGFQIGSADKEKERQDKEKMLMAVLKATKSYPDLGEFIRAEFEK
jgi:ABC-type lipoprotein release transport system permease subunit